MKINKVAIFFFLLSGFLLKSGVSFSEFESKAKNKKQFRSLAQEKSGSSAQKFMTDIQELIEQKDDLGVRAYIIKNRGYRLQFEDWLYVRDLLNTRPQVGYDLIYHWDKFTPQSEKKVFAQKIKMDKALSKADQLMSDKKFDEAFQLYQVLAKAIKKHFDFDPKQNGLIYYTVLHSMARALYGAGRFEEATAVYQWIRPFYPKYRVVLFEQMWAAFRADKVDVALGAISSQKAHFFSEFLEPEVYLLEIYLYKKLCRQKDLAYVVESIQKFKNHLESGKYSYKEWAASEIETRALLHLSEMDATPFEHPSVSLQQRNAMKEKIIKNLEARFDREKVRILEQLRIVEAHSGVAVNLGSKGLKPAGKLPTREAWFKKGFEIWPVEDTEYWIDEIGNRRFLGESQCGVSKKS